MPQGDPLVSIRCLVYNHEPYLRQCLDGFVMQQTTFPFEAIVHDDASTDGSAAIIREYAEKYPDIIKPIYETENQYCKQDGSLTRAMDEAMHPESKYVAMCEGDDYWTDPNKLQMQVDIMEADSEVGLVHGKVKVYNQERGIFLDKLWGNPCLSFEDELLANKIISLTVCFRKELYVSYRELRSKSSKGFKMGDYPMWLYMSHHAKTAFVEKPLGVYRILEHSASHDPDVQKMANFELSVFDAKVFFAQQFHYEHMLKDLATNVVYKLQDMSLNENHSIDYDIRAINRKYGLNNSVRLIIMDFILRNDFLRCVYLRYLRYRMGVKNE